MNPRFCIRQPGHIIRGDLTPIADMLGTYLEKMATRKPNTRTRLTLEFEHETSSENPWGDFAKWNIIERQIETKSIATEMRLFP